MTAPAALHRQLADEHTAKQRQYVRSNTRARWRSVGIAVTLLTGARAAGGVPIPGSFIAGFPPTFAAGQYGFHCKAPQSPVSDCEAYLNFHPGTARLTSW